MEVKLRKYFSKNIDRFIKDTGNSMTLVKFCDLMPLMEFCDFVPLIGCCDDGIF